MDGTRSITRPNTSCDLAQFHNKLAVELERLHEETLTMQSALSPFIAKSMSDATAISSIQKLDAHAQILSDLASILHELGQSTQNNKVDLSALKKLKILPSTAAAILGHRAEHQSTPTISGDVTFF